MTAFPMYLSEYPSLDDTFPFHLSINEVKSVFPAHRHSYLEFSLVIEGFGSEIINGKKHTMEPGTFTFILPYQIHEIIAEQQTPLRLFNCIFSFNLMFEIGLESFLLDAQDVEPQPYVKLGEDDFQKLKLILNEMLEEYRGSKPFKHILLKAKIAEAFVLFERIRQGAQPAYTTYYGPSKKDAMWDILRYIHLHYQEDITLSHLAKQFHISAPYLSELFKEKVGQNFVSFLHDIRIQHACSLLSSTDISVSEIAFEVGYGSLKTFSRVFRDQRNMTPTTYRKMHTAG